MFRNSLFQKCLCKASTKSFSQQKNFKRTSENKFSTLELSLFTEIVCWLFPPAFVYIPVHLSQEAKNNNLLSGSRLLRILTLHAARVEECFITENRLLLQSLPSTRTIRVNRWGSRQKLRSPMNYTEMTAKCFPNGLPTGAELYSRIKWEDPRRSAERMNVRQATPLPFHSTAAHFSLADWNVYQEIAPPQNNHVTSITWQFALKSPVETKGDRIECFVSIFVPKRRNLEFFKR